MTETFINEIESEGLMVMRSVPLNFTYDELVEIYHALESKVMEIKARHLGPAEDLAEYKRWIGKLEKIMTKISDYGPRFP